MKKLAITMAVLAATGATYAQAENNTSAQTTITKQVAEVCNIGMWANTSAGETYLDGGAIDGIDAYKSVSSELNNDTTNKVITANAQCNATLGYEVYVQADRGDFVADTSAAGSIADVGYTLTNMSSSDSEVTISSPGTAYDPAEGVDNLIGSTTSTDVKAFKVKLDADDFVRAGSYNETLIFTISTL